MVETLSPPPKPPRRRAAGMPTEAPRLTIHYRCPVCSVDVVADAYDGPPVCEGKDDGAGGKHRAWMVALWLVSGEDKPGPLADIVKAKSVGEWHLGKDGYAHD